MKITDAIKILTDAKERGVTSIILSHWTAKDCGFDESDPIWEYITEEVMDKDWSYINDRVDEMVAAAFDDIKAESEENNYEDT